MNILLTGANGMLGKCFQKEITKSGHILYISGNNDLSNNAIKIDITDYQLLKTATDELEITHIINCAADRDPESCLNNPTKAYSLNAGGVENLARIANIHNAKLCHISTDYVFAGDTPPYKETDTPSPVNAYGRSKLAGEIAAQTAAKHLILRIPALYRTDINDQRNLFYKLNNDLAAGKELYMDNMASRFYTLADEIAEAALILLEKDIAGTVHLSAQERTTKADFARLFARINNYDEKLIKDIDTPQESIEKRPKDSHLNTEYFSNICDYVFTTPSQAIHK